MYKIFFTVRDRFAITRKSITALVRHSTLPFSLYIYDNLSSSFIQERFVYYSILYEKKILTQLTINTADSTFSAFSKAVSSNDFGLHHEMDPKKDSYDFLVFLDNDIIVCPEWDQVLKRAWLDVKRLGLTNVKVIGQLPGGIKFCENLKEKIAGVEALLGKFGGSGFWCVQPNFFREVGYLDVQRFINISKRHDQEYWKKLDKVTGGKPYILGLKTTLAIHTGKYCGSVCNYLTKFRSSLTTNFNEQEETIEKLSFEEFFNMIKNDKELVKDW